MSTLISQIRQSRLYPALALEQLVSRRLRKVFIWSGWLIAFILLGLLLRAHYTGEVAQLRPLFGALIVCATLGLFIYLTEAFFRSYYFGSIVTNDYQPRDLFTFTVGRILYDVRGDDVLGAFINSATGTRVLRRLGLNAEEVASFTKTRQVSTGGQTLSLGSPEPLTLKKLADWLYQSDAGFAKFLFRHQVSQSDLDGAVDWVVAEIENAARRERWWSRERLERVPGIAKDWAYGGTYTLDQYAEDLLAAEQSAHFAHAVAMRSHEVRELETVLLRAREANALLVGEAGEGKMDVVWELANEIKTGRVVPALESHRPVLLRVSLLLADQKERQGFEQMILKLLAEAATSGNVILVIDNLPLLLAGAEKLGSDLPALLNPYLDSSALTIVALADNDGFHRYLENNSVLRQRFELIKVGEADRSRVLNFLQDKTNELEARTGLFFTYLALTELVASAERYFQDESVADQALDLLIELVPWAAGRGQRTIEREDVISFVGEKTRIPMGAVAGSERESLLGLEDKLKQQVVGQTAALRAVSQALLRNRAGLGSQSRPIGTFLFLGPTGVGKTETAKALARVMFGREEALLRLDMSEYQSGDALNRLIGSFAENKPGILSTLIRENPYGILLLDEFEKTEKGVLNLFLQILDEGFFSDAFGRRVNARNLVIIATSNAAAQQIWHLVESGRDPAAARADVINQLVSQAIFRPELLNRFDEIVFFHPLSMAELEQVAKLLLQKTTEHLRDQGIEFRVGDELVKLVAQAGTDKVFGARPLRRFIQDQVEQQVANAIIRGEISAGSTVEWRGGRLQRAA